MSRSGLMSASIISTNVGSPIPVSSDNLEISTSSKLFCNCGCPTSSFDNPRLFNNNSTFYIVLDEYLYGLTDLPLLIYARNLYIVHMSSHLDVVFSLSLFFCKFPFFFTLCYNIFRNSFDKPETYCNNATEAVFTFTPTWLTAVSTTNVNDSFNLFEIHHADIVQPQLIWDRSLQVQQVDLCRRLPIETALLSSTCKSGNSSRAKSEAEYTLAPASFTII